jgi:hypothetical protein
VHDHNIKDEHMIIDLTHSLWRPRTSCFRMIQLQEVATIAGSSVEECTEECPGDKTSFERILGMTINKQGNIIYVADMTSVRSLSIEYKFVRTLIGTSMSGNADGSSKSAAFSLVTGLTMSPDFKSIYFSDW